ncbi:hypothetical protein [Bradyrhizobium sp. McL0616]|uniref:hypothetical protein n=1 Tax=Bradyrhizobium sp. McL0616 TaxID=3415674 RepID=UPI003CE76A02
MANLNIGSSLFSGLGGAASDLFAAEGDRSKAQGDLLEKKNYDMASYPVAGANRAAGPNPTLSAIALDWIASAVSVKSN